MYAGEVLSRDAEAAFWFGRYMERAEALARVLYVMEAFTRDPDGAGNWYSMVQINADEAAFAAAHGEATHATVKQFYLRRPDNPSSLRFIMRAARANARRLRPLISDEVWVHVNTMYNWVEALRAADLQASVFPATCRDIREACQTLFGVADSTWYRDHAWRFYQIGRLLERADQTTRLLDIKYHLLLRAAPTGKMVDLSQWQALLRSVAGYHSYLRTHAGGIAPDRVVRYLVLDPAFPRSVAYCVEQLRFWLTESGPGVADAVAALAAELSLERVDAAMADSLHNWLDRLQVLLAAVAGETAQAYFSPPPAALDG